MENQYERFFKLLYSLLSMVMSGARKIKWLCDQLQKIVDIPQPHRVFRLQIPDYWEAVSHFDRLRPPQRGEQIMEAIGPFYQERPRHLYPQTAIDEQELLDLVHQGLFWSGMAGVKVTYECPLPFIARTEGPKYLSQSLNDWMLHGEFGYNFRRESRRSPLLLDPNFRDIEEMLKAMQAVREMVLKEVFTEPIDLSDRLRPRPSEERAYLVMEMEHMVTAAAWFKAIDYKRADAMHALLQLYRRGNFPIAIDPKDNKVLVFCSV